MSEVLGKRGGSTVRALREQQPKKKKKEKSREGKTAK